MLLFGRCHIYHHSLLIHVLHHNVGQVVDPPPRIFPAVVEPGFYPSGTQSPRPVLQTSLFQPLVDFLVSANSWVWWWCAVVAL